MRKIIPKLSAKTIKQQLSPREFYEEENGLQSSRDHGWVDGGLCPFHDDSRSGNFRLNLDFGGYRCFACGAKGSDVIAFIQRRDGSHNGNFRVNLDFGGYRCFACGAKGSDVIDFIRQRDGLPFSEALCYLRDRYGAGR